MVIKSRMAVETRAPKGKLVKVGPTHRMDKSGTSTQASYVGLHQQDGRVLYTKHVNDGETYWTYSQPYTAAGGSR